MELQAVLLLSFGGPEGPEQVRPFLANVTHGRGIPPERLDAVAEHYLHFGGVSPINAIDRIRTPLLLIHGKKDVTVDHAQSAKMHSAMTKAGKSVEFVSIPLADHYFTREADRMTLLTAIEVFLAKHNPPD